MLYYPDKENKLKLEGELSSQTSNDKPNQKETLSQAPTHLLGALVRPDPGSSSCVCVYELANQSQDGKCQI